MEPDCGDVYWPMLYLTAAYPVLGRGGPNELESLKIVSSMGWNEHQVSSGTNIGAVEDMFNSTSRRQRGNASSAFPSTLSRYLVVDFTIITSFAVFILLNP
jgi:hypothetical protein